MRILHRTEKVQQGKNPARALWQKTRYYTGQKGWVIQNPDGHYWGGPCFDEEWWPTLDRTLPNGITVSQVAVFTTKNQAELAWIETWGQWYEGLTILNTRTITSQ
ncbi:hypothetical protein [Mycobacteroides immunogenum]|uniref:hypothetical protein n=1 Tax=Mycobacteroides immunogenum TaxID=83262 RepID=UPI000A4A7870|nr:hypothetical protein [Mycobacteroides immunogenum]